MIESVRVLKNDKETIMMGNKESEVLEYKLVVVDDIKNSIIAFANSKGGTLYVGISDSGDVVGLSDVDGDMLKINNMLRDGIKPVITLFASCFVEHKEGKNIIKINVQRGTNRPYYSTGKGIRPEGVFVRQGAASVPATETAIRKMISDTDGDSFESLRSLQQDLSFESLQLEFNKRKVSLGPSQMSSLRLLNTDGIYSNLALLLSEQCRHTVKAAVFQDDSQQIFKDRKEFSGSLFKQLNEVYEYLDLSNRIVATFDGLHRNDMRDYPEIAVREALLNAIVHREYSTSSSVIIKTFPNRLEFISPGGLVNNIEIEDIKTGYSICRNPFLAAVFYRLQLIEAYGTGILKIFEAYKSSLKQPIIEVTPNVFKLILPNLNEDLFSDKELLPDEKVMKRVRKNGYINRKETEELLGLSQTAAGTILRKLVDKGLLVREENSRNTRYTTNEKN